MQVGGVSGRKPEERVAVDPVGIGVSPGHRVAFEANNGHIGRDTSGDPTSKLWRFGADNCTRRKV